MRTNTKQLIKCGMGVCIEEGCEYMRGERIFALAMVGKRLCSRAR
jgi:hypothetical protein